MQPRNCNSELAQTRQEMGLSRTGQESRPEILLNCCAFSREGLALAFRLDKALAERPWISPSGETVCGCKIHAPQRLANTELSGFESFPNWLASNYHSFRAHVFIGALGIAVRALAPLLTHKCLDPPVVVLDPAGKHVISVLSGHWGGGNALTRHLASLLGAEPVISTASDALENADFALDLLIRHCGLKILDWQEVPSIQGMILEGQQIDLDDPERLLPDKPFFHPVDNFSSDDRQNCPRVFISVHWKARTARAGLLRLAVPRLYLGLGFRYGVSFSELLCAVRECMVNSGLELAALAGLASVAEKAADKAAIELAKELDLSLQGFKPEELARCSTPNPSSACGRRFGQKPFSACEAAAMLAAGGGNKDADISLIMPKIRWHGRVTLAVALGPIKTYCGMEAQ